LLPLPKSSYTGYAFGDVGVAPVRACVELDLVVLSPDPSGPPNPAVGASSSGSEGVSDPMFRLACIRS
jgi:hypothetical protein